MEFSISTQAFEHISYSSGIETGISWEDVFLELENSVPQIKQSYYKDQSWGIGLSLSNQALRELDNPFAFSELRQFLSTHQCYLFSLHGFNKDLFDWKDPKLLSYHNSLATLLTKLLPPQITGSISTVAGTPKLNNRALNCRDS